jgi:uncharacterized membrane protein
MEEVTRYEVFLFCHILAVIAWVGTDMVLQLLAVRARAAGGQRMMDMLGDTEWLGKVYLVPSSLLVVIFGFLLLSESNGAYELSQFWVAAGLGVFVASFLAGAGFLGPESGRLGKLAEERGPDDPDVQRRVKRIFLVSRIELVLLILVVLDMVVKPGL